MSDRPRFDAMLDDLARCVLEQGAAEGPCECDVQFRAEAGQLLIVVSGAGGREWRVARALPD